VQKFCVKNLKIFFIVYLPQPTQLKKLAQPAVLHSAESLIFATIQYILFTLVAICKGTVLARFFIGYIFPSNRFFAGAFFEFSSLRDVVFAMLFAAAPPNSQNSTVYVVMLL
jgi:hypothetical protein